MRNRNYNIPKFFEVLRLGTMLLALLSFTCAPKDPYSITRIGGPVTIGPKQTAFLFETPYKPAKQEVKICFRYEDDLEIPGVSVPPTFQDGTNLELTASLADTNGREYSLDHITNSSRNYLCISPQLTPEWMDISKKEVSFVKLSVQANRQVRIKVVEWVAVNMWDL
jgi:hypothetical protein